MSPIRHASDAQMDAATWCRHLVPDGSVYAFLADHRHELFPPELFADLTRQGGGHPSVPAEVIASVMVLQALAVLRYIVLTCGNRKPPGPPSLTSHSCRAGQRLAYGEPLRTRSHVGGRPDGVLLEGRSDREAISALRRDIAWKVACGLRLDDEGFHPTVLVYWRNRLRTIPAILVLSRQPVPGEPGRYLWMVRQVARMARARQAPVLAGVAETGSLYARRGGVELSCRVCGHRPRMRVRDLYAAADQALTEGRIEFYV
jgi:hypothetical protein